MSIFQSIKFVFFFILLWFLIMLINVQVHELGHAVVMSFYGWQHQLVYFGGTNPTAPEFMLAVAEWISASNLDIETAGSELTIGLFNHLATTLEPMRMGVMGGWIGQLVTTAFLFILVNRSFFKEGASATSRMLANGYILINLAWMGGNWLFMGAQQPTSSDGIILINVILNDNRILIGLLWVVGLLMILLSLFLAKRLGPQMFTPLGLSAENGQALARFTTIATAIVATGVSLSLPLPVYLALTVLIIAIVPFVLIRRLHSRQTNQTIQPPRLAWFNTIMGLTIIFSMILTQSGIFVNGNASGIEQSKSLMLTYCQETQCLPTEYDIWYNLD